jgi:catalase
MRTRIDSVGVQDASVKEPAIIIAGDADRYNNCDGSDDYRQAGDLFRLISAAQKERLFDNIKAVMDGPMEIIKRQVSLFYRADPGYGVGVANRMGLAEVISGRRVRPSSGDAIVIAIANRCALLA